MKKLISLKKKNLFLKTKLNFLKPGKFFFKYIS
jgi:hypothetical protein